MSEVQKAAPQSSRSAIDMSLPIPDWLQQLLRISRDGVYVFDREFRICYWNDVLHPIYGLLREEVLQQSLFEVLPFLGQSAEGEGLRQALFGKTTELSDCAYALPALDRSGFTESHFTPLCDPLGAVIGGIAVIRDITARKREEARVRETELRFHSMADSSPVLLWMADTTGLCTFFNQTWLRFTGRTLDEEHGVGWAEGVHPFDFQHCVDTYIENFNVRRPFEMEYRLRRADGEFRWILDRGAPRYNPDGSFAGFIGSCTDITERKNLESALQKALVEAEAASRVKSEFLANISHELRTPLNAIVNIPLSALRDFPTLTVWHCERCGSAFQDQEESLDPAEIKAPTCPQCKEGALKSEARPYFTGDAKKTSHFLGRLAQSGQHMLQVVNDLLDFAKLEAGRMQLSRSPVDIVSVIEEIAQTLNPLAAEKGISLSYPTGQSLGAINLQADGVKLAQIFINLVGNAIKFTPAGGSIAIGISAESDSGGSVVRCFVKDTGIGIPKEKQQLIFESFRQIDGSHTRAHQGTGLGLTITKQLIELHGGKIWLDSEVDAGSTFSFLLPKQGPPQAEAPKARRSAKVLVIDDSPADLELARTLLESEGFDVELLSHPESAVRAVQELSPDCIILDIMMPRLSGLTLLRQFKSNAALRAIPVLVSTAYYYNREAVQQLGGIWIPKPWNARELVSCIQSQLLDGRSARSRDASAVEGRAL